MKNRIAPIIALMLVLGALDASAQGEELEFPPQPVAPQAAPGPAPATQCTVAPSVIDLALYAEYAAQANRRAREIDRLNAVMDREGSEFSEEKYGAYRSRLTGGALLIALGGASMFAAMVTGISLEANSSSSDEYDEYDDSAGEDSSSRLLPGLPLGLLFGGIAAVGIGVPLTISGARGKKRQDLLRRKYEILTPYEPSVATLSVFVDPDRGSGGLNLKVTF